MASSSLLGSPSDRWPLARAVDALGEAARRAGTPGLIWIAGACYPGLGLNVALLSALLGLAEQYTGVDLPLAEDPTLLLTLFTSPHVAAPVPAGDPVLKLAVALVLLPVFFAVFRLTVGLAKASDPTLWDAGEGLEPYVVESGLVRAEELREGRPQLRIRTAWRAGRGLGVVALGLWAMLVVLLLGAGLVLIGPVVVVLRAAGLEEASPLLAGLLVPSLAVLLAYAVVLMVLNQLALHSLAHNRRGVSSALTHAWRLVRTSPMSALRATVVDFVLSLAILALEVLLLRAVLPEGTEALLVFLLYGFGGVTRAGFWARAYRALGGPSSADHVPGLAPSRA